MTTSPEIFVLLGAGASAPVPMPLGFHLNDAVEAAQFIDTSTTDFKPDGRDLLIGSDQFWNALPPNTVIEQTRDRCARAKAALLAVRHWCSAHGGDDGYERVASVLHQLHHELKNEPHPVTRAALDSLIAEHPAIDVPTIADDLHDALGLIRDIVARAISGSAGGGIRGDLEHLDFLATLIQVFSRVHVATLNYDLSLETWCRNRGFYASSGFVESGGVPTWSPELGDRFPDDADVWITKPHGSIDWWTNAYGGTASVWRSLNAYGDVGGSLPSLDRPYMLMGDLAKQSQYADEVAAFQLTAMARSLHRSHAVVTIGYSFRDRRINKMLSTWQSRRHHDVVVVTPSRAKLIAESSSITSAGTILDPVSGTGSRCVEAKIQDLDIDELFAALKTAAGIERLP